MAKIHPQTQRIPTCSSSYMTSEKESFTIWMKSLVFHGNGCTVFDSNGEIVYRIDNYNTKSSNEVYLMDLQGKVLFSIRRKKLSIFGHWDIYRWSGSQMKKWFQARKNCNILGGDMACQVILGRDKAKSIGYRILGLTGKLEFKITDNRGELVAEVKPKQLSSGLMLGDDVLTLVVEPQIDHSIIMALVTVYGLMTDKI
ncbi:Protein LURP-one-related like [Actinidia chinensis var. chinensis]|uniref:Protein LURP-one-related like n=1 Tax=Actinidia chinensis var. chinensis TaxID=1590841 RepID=A0A2R6Q8D0_ACTCC|nr:Protein LURP-one-related like [Actinidia chinensis var. chinensis]